MSSAAATGATQGPGAQATTDAEAATAQALAGMTTAAQSTAAVTTVATAPPASRSAASGKTPRFANAIVYTDKKIPPSGGPSQDPFVFYPINIKSVRPTIVFPPQLACDTKLYKKYPSLDPRQVPVPELHPKTKQAPDTFHAEVTKWAGTLPQLTDSELSDVLSSVVNYATHLIDAWYPKPYLFSMRSCRIINFIDLDKVLAWYTGSNDAAVVEKFIRDFEHAIQYPDSSFCSHFIKTVDVGTSSTRVINALAFVFTFPMFIVQLDCLEASCRAFVMAAMLSPFLGYEYPIAASIAERLSWFGIRYCDPSVYRSQHELVTKFNALVDQLRDERKLRIAAQQAASASASAPAAPTTASASANQVHTLSREQVALAATASSILQHNVEAYKVLVDIARTTPANDDTKTVTQVAIRNILYWVKLVNQLSMDPTDSEIAEDEGATAAERPSKRKTRTSSAAGSAKPTKRGRKSPTF